ncbi:tyrosine-protein kinase family protein [Aliigemmobacter aestuarii]|uniref:Tyrosine-protein kinase family protein n=1 Tax=Aliigemmobacter aestuarii TaxID=1445661 RepID=A0A4S3MQH3_9RHOB|nr:CpsD/CapB family tyrosine-protein kinase [Gemmobacter aestuarii]THD83631.1 tyrosine-protein kinase family protein [Gemmobacter aestuarii]
MNQRNLLISGAENTSDAGHYTMTDSRPDKKSTPPGQEGRGVFSVFRPGRGSDQPGTGLDLAKARGMIVSPLPVLRPRPDRVWESLTPVTLNPDHLAGNGLFPTPDKHGVSTYFDILRTRAMQALEERRWRRIGVTSPTHGCGKSFVAANLALSLGRLPATRSVLMDMELRNPVLSRMLGVKSPGPMRDYLTGEQPLESHFRVHGRNLALALNDQPVEGASELLLSPFTGETLAAMMEHLDPDMVVCDLPHALGNDDVIAMLPQLDAILLVTDGTMTTAEDIRRCERLFEGRMPILGVVLNRAQDRNAARYRYGTR